MTWKDCFDPKNFKASVRSSLAIILSVGILAFLWKASFAGMDSLSSEAKLIIGYLAGVLTMICGFYFGGNLGGTSADDKKEEVGK